MTRRSVRGRNALGLAGPALACLAGMPVLADDEPAGKEAPSPEPARPEVHAEQAGREPDDGERKPKESWTSGASTSKLSPGDFGSGTDQQKAGAEQAAGSDSPTEALAEEAGREPDDGERKPKESWTSGASTSDLSPPDADADAAGGEGD